MPRETWAATRRHLLAVWLTLVLLMFTSLGVAYLPLGEGWKAAAGLVIAGVKAGLVVLVFMQLGRRHLLARLVVAVALWTLLVMGGLSGVDYLTRSVEPAEVQLPQQLLPRRAPGPGVPVDPDK